MESRPFILITNDDGIQAPGIKHLWNSLKEIADLAIVAPLHEQSSVSLSITVRNPLHIKKIEWPKITPAWSINGTPADCVKLALSVILKKKPDLIVSGINRGTNAGRNVLYSGTVAAAIEGVLKGVPSIAFSCCEYSKPNYALFEQYIPIISQYILNQPLPKGTLLNVNFPAISEGVKGVKLTRQGKEYWAENPEERVHPIEGHSYYWLGAELKEFEEEENSDIAWLKNDYVTAVPIRIADLTDEQQLVARKSTFESLFSSI